MTTLDKRVSRLEADHESRCIAVCDRLLPLLSIGELEPLAEFGEHDPRSRPALDRLRALATPAERLVLGL